MTIFKSYIFWGHLRLIWSERGSAERRILVPGCDGVGGSAGEPCLFVCLFVCLFRVGRGLLALPNTKWREKERSSEPPWRPPRNIWHWTKILYFQCFVTTDMFLFCKPIFFSGNYRIFRDLAFGSVKTRFKAFWDIFSKICMRPWIRRLIMFFMNFCPWRATKVRSL